MRQTTDKEIAKDSDLWEEDIDFNDEDLAEDFE